MRILNKVVVLILTIFLATTFTFISIRMMPGDPAKKMALDLVRQKGITYEQAYNQAKISLNYDPNEPVLSQYVKYMKMLAKGNLGESSSYRKPVVEIIASSLPWTLFILSISLFISFFLGIFLGMYIVWNKKTTADSIVTAYSSVANSFPDYILAMFLIVIFGTNLKWFPSRGAYDSSVTAGFNIKFIINVLQHSVLPAMTYIITGLGTWALSMKGSAKSVLSEDYITAARARGLKENRIRRVYVGKNAILPLVTSLALAFGFMFGGSPLVENIFVYPGIGYFFSQSIGRRDFSLMQALFLLTSIAVVIANLIAELLYSVLDPRVR